MDNYREEIVTRRKGRTLYSIMYILVFVFMLISAIIAFTYLMAMMSGGFSAPNVVMLVLFGGMAFLLWRNKDTLRTEYEYTFTNGELDIAKVMGNSRRKHLLSLQVKNVEQGGPVASDNYTRASHTPGIKKLFYALNNDAAPYYLYYTREGARYLLIMEPSEQLVTMMRIYNRSFQAL